MTFQIYQSGKAQFHSNQSEAIALAGKSYLGEIKDGKVHYSLYETLYLLDAKKAEVLNSKNKKLKHSDLIKKANPILYAVFKDLRNKGYILKEGLKFGSDFRVYSKGDKPGKSHAKYLLEALSSNKKLNPKDFAAKSRVAHSTNKILLLALVDSESDISYYEIAWKSRE